MTRPAGRITDQRLQKVGAHDVPTWSEWLRSFGISGLVVVDTDREEGARWAQAYLPDTPSKAHTAKGIHRYYRRPGVPTGRIPALTTSSGVHLFDRRDVESLRDARERDAHAHASQIAERQS